MQIPAEPNIEYILAFEDLIKKAVEADFNEEFTVLYDEHYFKYLPSFIALANEKLMKVTYIFLPDSYQQVIQNNKVFYQDGEIGLPAGMRMAINKSNIVLNFLTGRTNSSKVRGAVLNYIKDDGCKVIHCPKLSEEVLKIVRASDFEKVHADCEMMAWLIGNSNHADLITIGPKGEELRLSIPLGGWVNDPFISGGIIPENSWGNVPPGESFWCPVNSSVNGSVCITGSVPSYLFTPGEYLWLDFVDGKISNYETTPASGVSDYLYKLETEMGVLMDEGWNKFAELGIGLNPAIKSLTGNALFDEKMAGTVHIAIGDNVSFGHSNQSHIHEDFVILQPTLIFDGRVVVDNGMLDMEVIKRWRSEFIAPLLPISEESVISFIPAKIDLTGHCIRRLLNKGKRLGYINIFGEANNDLASFLEEFFDDGGDEIYFSDLLKNVHRKIEPKTLKKMVETLVHYKMAFIN